MKLELAVGEKITITFAESDGEIEVAFTEIAIEVSTDWPDSTGRRGVIYREVFGGGGEQGDGVAS